MNVEPWLRSLQPFLVAAPILGLVIGLTALHGGFRDLFIISLMLATLLVMLALAAQIVARLGDGEIGLDVIALLSMGAALLFGEYLAAAVVALMYSGGQYIENIAEGRARREMTALLSRAPRTATRRRDGRLEEVAVDMIDVGDRLLVRRGDLVSVDGVIGEETALLDESALTGEPLPVRKRKGEAIMSGAANAGDLFSMVATKPASQSTYSGILKLVEAAQRSKAPMARLADRYALLFLALTVALASIAWLLSGDPVRAVAVLVVATPCPLILAVPIAWSAGVSRAARSGLLIKGARVLEGLSRVRSLVIDKTGTLTEGKPRLASINSALPEDELLRLVASLDQASSHVAARALVDAAQARNLDLVSPSNVSENRGEGIAGEVAGKLVAIGGIGYIATKFRIPIEYDHCPGTIAAAVAIDGTFAGILLFSDKLREGTDRILAGFRRLGLERIILATGDRGDVARQISHGLPFDEVRSDLSPEQKIEIVRAEKQRGPVMMIGDGTNDAPALAAADIGIAIGAHGSAAAAEAADAVLLVERLDRVLEGIEIAQGCRRIALQSVFAGIGLSVAGMIVAAMGYLTPVQGALFQEMVDVAVILNALRALRIRAAFSSTGVSGRPPARDDPDAKAESMSSSASRGKSR
ncbi:heavy metal translocating P-type ATPase (plasmid) [Agrobacterium vitis]|uniref:heavy metal translocating P-type ATPase n=1 Tax=Agrobacterium vitis TaxID=373 RepID=UPI003D2E2847